MRYTHVYNFKINIYFLYGLVKYCLKKIIIMETVRACGCKGIRTCLICEHEYNIIKPNTYKELQKLPSYQNFLDERETKTLIQDLDSLPWDISQSGRRKQNYGPKCNFKKRKLCLGIFNGFPINTEFVQKKLSQVPLLQGFRTIEQCSLEYTPERGASIDPHIDDCWIWGERIVTVNVIGDSVLTMTRYQGSNTRYNLDCVSTYPPVVPQSDCSEDDLEKAPEDVVIRLPMPARSLMVLYGDARYNWDHAVLREDVTSRRLSAYLTGSACKSITGDATKESTFPKG
ncbi:Similar to ALKBH4: Alpha-ketoglutarate-dependent dioxygenase alkB homolog 4 (Homo sapiens) [Cotesia congregata]|uniref:Similar to ALKBH4: Alpha-ketoglutarate-dependent dioxygenase alkB homolog 4 (Homo sapiens) n=1 Tax=Cotesia congregata TaxID=51543 RepID=A0A8J2HAD3_COTCN|nr:Similar to ALKBH4: Alpha-ketoglutarate-dependent dioxygenase alkB homolog 4 (Homo sapiens) [Cotesia congregata]